MSATRAASTACGTQTSGAPTRIGSGFVTARIRPFSTGRTYINFQTAEEGTERVQASYGANFDRLAEIKSKYDPDNRNISPAA